MKSLIFLIALSVITLVTARSSYSHCQIPCGIYDDSARVAAMKEHVTTIAKSVKRIIELSFADKQDHNQIVRWITNKEDHANKLQEIAAQYFMYQRIAPVDNASSSQWDSYIEKLTLLHKITVQAMKAKQSTGLSHVETLRTLIENFETTYFGD